MSQQSQNGVIVSLPDGSKREFDGPVSVSDVAYDIGPGLGEDCLAGIVDGNLVAPEYRIGSNSDLRIVTPGSEDAVRVLRHSAAHVLAQAVSRLFPDAKLAIGPPTDEGFYYDFDGLDIDEDDLADIEAEMRDIVSADYDIVREEVSPEEARERLADQPYKLELLDDIAADEPVTFYRQGEFEDLCAGPHVASTGEVGALSLLEIAGAYWRGDEDEAMLTRMYGTAFERESELESFLERREEAAKRDHRKIGREMDLFSVPDHSPGCVNFHPNGMAIRRELEEYVREKNAELGYEEVKTPELNHTELWKKSGHYDHFKEEGEMFAWEQNGHEYGLKPMNCANHAHIYDDQRRSYRDLPLRFSEFGMCYRNEQSGELSGMLRVRGFTQDDGHAFVRPEGIREEIARTLSVIDGMYEAFGLDAHLVLETKPDDAIGDDELWERAHEALRNALEDEGLEYDVAEGEGAFYGPKIAINVEDAIGREWTIGTVQLDFVQPERLDISYVGEDNEEHRPVMIHRALLGSMERFMGVFIEHVAGKFPFWLAPEQVRILPITDDESGYAEEIADELGSFRVEVDDRDWTLGKKIRAGHDDRVPYMIIVGSDEAESGTISVRDREERQEGGVERDDFRRHLEAEYGEKRLHPDFLD
ncbi:threonyl-tRNA synthetase [Haladaptatus paucihalophilus DX253]|uniref:Threonine--tRNA ligase n=1 Tax=Haladaptatus paucihalophilus DX253 TaxID=797209 RepID=E7QXT0_HALPU|nr:threonine--tRNA ligase [Haladaptatus paucihalophilus]EFW90631.1 threonyl-tRNA synthetase [Haladaptatus paucihalophilus DX253]SHL56765.1 threonyl-tRNA synthetase [Haladaptatus paucihalophilus DX253]